MASDSISLPAKPGIVAYMVEAPPFIARMCMLPCRIFASQNTKELVVN